MEKSYLSSSSLNIIIIKQIFKICGGKKSIKKWIAQNILHPCIHGCAYILWYSKINQNMSFLNNILHIKHAVLSKMRVWALIGVSGLFSMNLSKEPLIKTPLNDTCSATSSAADGYRASKERRPAALEPMKPNKSALHGLLYSLTACL